MTKKSDHGKGFGLRGVSRRLHLSSSMGRALLALQQVKEKEAVKVQGSLLILINNIIMNENKYFAHESFQHYGMPGVELVLEKLFYIYT